VQKWERWNGWVGPNAMPALRGKVQARPSEAPPSQDREVTCLNCGGPLPARQSHFALKYFLVDPRRNRPVYAARSAGVRSLGRPRIRVCVVVQFRHWASILPARDGCLLAVLDPMRATPILLRFSLHSGRIWILDLCPKRPPPRPVGRPKPL